MLKAESRTGTRVEGGPTIGVPRPSLPARPRPDYGGVLILSVIVMGALALFFVWDLTVGIKRKDKAANLKNGKDPNTKKRKRKKTVYYPYWN